MFSWDQDLRGELETLRAEGLDKVEGRLQTPQSRTITVAGRELVNLCANNYLGLADHPAMIAAAREALDRWGFGMASVRFICGTTELHTELEARLAGFLGTEAAILYSSCFDANGGLFETLTDERDAIISDELNHASIIDGVRLSKARRYRYRNRDLADLETQLVASQDARRRLVVTDGVFSMDGYLAPLPEICDLAERYDATVVVDDSHAVGFMGASGAGTPEHLGVSGRVDIITGTLGKALGGASGGYVAGPASPVPVLKFAGALDRGRGPGGAGPAGIVGRLARPAPGEHQLPAVRFRRAGLRGARIAAPNRAGHDRGRGTRCPDGRPDRRCWCVRAGLLLPGGAPRQGPDPDPSLGRAHPGRPGPGLGRFYCGPRNSGVVVPARAPARSVVSLRERSRRTSSHQIRRR